MPVFDEFRTRETNPESGLYLCDGCCEIIPLSKDERFPPCETCGAATWMMVAVAGARHLIVPFFSFRIARIEIVKCIIL